MPEENGVLPPYIPFKTWNSFNIDTTSLTFAPGLHTITVKTFVMPRSFVIDGFTDTSKIYNVAFTCLMTSSTSLTDINYLLLVDPTTIPLPSFNFTPSYCSTYISSVLWNVVSLPSFATLDAATG